MSTWRRLVTQQFNTTSLMGRLTLTVPLSFAQLAGIDGVSPRFIRMLFNPMIRNGGNRCL